MGYRGLALGTAIAALFNAGTLLFLLSRRLDGIEGRAVLISFLKILVASVLMGAASYFVSMWLTSQLPSHEWYWRAVRVFGAIAAGIIVLAGAAHALSIEEFNDAVDRVRRRLGRR